MSLLRAHEGVTEDRVEVSRANTHTPNHPLHTRIDHTLERAIPRARSLVARAMRLGLHPSDARSLSRASRAVHRRDARHPPPRDRSRFPPSPRAHLICVYRSRVAKRRSSRRRRARRLAPGARVQWSGCDAAARSRIRRPRQTTTGDDARGGDVGLVGAGILRVLVGVDARVGVGAGVGVGVAREGGKTMARARAMGRERWRARARGRGEDDGESA